MSSSVNINDEDIRDIEVPMNILDTSTASRGSKSNPKDQSTALTQDITSVNMDGTLKTQSSRKSILLRVDSSVLELASAMRDELEELGDDHSEDQRESHICCLVCCDLVRACKGVSLVTIMVACGVVFSIVGIVGAMKLQKYMVLISGLWYCVDVLRSAMSFQYVNLVVTACFAYPHFALFHALRKNQLTKKNYENEKYCFGGRRKSGEEC